VLGGGYVPGLTLSCLEDGPAWIASRLGLGSWRLRNSLAFGGPIIDPSLLSFLDRPRGVVGPRGSTLARADRGSIRSGYPDSPAAAYTDFRLELACEGEGLLVTMPCMPTSTSLRVRCTSSTLMWSFDSLADSLMPSWLSDDAVVECMV
jgi:hypothetical protein